MFGIFNENLKVLFCLRLKHVVGYKKLLGVGNIIIICLCYFCASDAMLQNYFDDDFCVRKISCVCALMCV